MTKSRGILGPRANWQPEELDLLASMYPDCHGADCAEWLGKTLSATYQAAKKIGSHKSAEYLASDTACRLSATRRTPGMVANQFKPGQQSWNKGRPGSETGTGTHPNSRRTQFKPGRKPEESRNYRPIGALRVSKDGYLELKVTDDPTLVPARRWVAVHRLVWEAAHGPIPRDHIVRFKEGAKTTVLELVTVDRLECITRAEHARRNHPVSRDPELARLVQLKGAITRQVNRIAREAQERA